MSKLLKALSWTLLIICSMYTIPLQAGWTPIPGIDVAPSGPGIVVSDIESDASGNATLVWSEYDNVNNITNIQAATLGKGDTVWSAPITLSSATGNNILAYPQVGINPSGYTVVVWTEITSTTTTVKSASRAVFGGAWSSPLTVSVPTTPTLQSQFAQVALDNAGNAVAVWLKNNGTKYIVQAATLVFNAPAWTNYADLSNPSFDANSPLIAIDASGNGVAVWGDLENTLIQSKTYSGGVWLPTITTLSTGIVPILKINASGVAVTNWIIQGVNNLLQTSRFIAGTWSSPSTVISTTDLIFQQSIAVDPNGNAIIVWGQANNTLSNVFTQSSNLPIASSTWSAPIPITPTIAQAFGSIVEVDAAGNATVVWSEVTGFIQSIIKAAMLPFGTNSWINTTTLTNTGNSKNFPQLTVDPTGYAVVGWQDSTISMMQATTYVPAPTLINVNPSQGPYPGGNSVTLTGTNFINVTDVKFGTVSASFAVNSDSTITAIAPPGTLGSSVDVRVTTAAGVSPISVNDVYTYINPVPTVTNVNPNVGPLVGGNSVTITGTNFINVISVNFGANNATYIVNSPTSITATVPPGTPGIVDVTVTSIFGTSLTSPNDQYTYLNAIPTVTNVNPNIGPFSGGNSVTITGTDFINVTSVSFGANNATYIVNSPTSITTTVPAGIPGTVDVRVTTISGTSLISPNDQYTYLHAAPTVTNVNPNFGPLSGGNSVTITGTDFYNVNSVNFGATSATFLVNSPTSITATVPPGGFPGLVNVTVNTQSGISPITPLDLYLYLNDAPTVTGITPNSGSILGGNTVTIAGTNFNNVTGVNFGSASASFVVNSPTLITAIVPPGTAGTVDVTVTTLAGTSPTSDDDQYTYQNLPPVPPNPPANFIGIVKKNKYLNTTACSLTATWTPSTTQNVVFYRIYKNNRVVKTISANDPLVFSACLHDCSAVGYSITAISTDHLESVHIPLTF